MGREVQGQVIEKIIDPPPGAPGKYWNYLMVEEPDGARVVVRLKQDQATQITVGDVVQFRKPFRKNKRTRVTRLA